MNYVLGKLLSSALDKAIAIAIAICTAATLVWFVLVWSGLVCLVPIHYEIPFNYTQTDCWPTRAKMEKSRNAQIHMSTSTRITA